MQGKILKAIILILGTILVASLIFDAAQTSNLSSYIKAATAVLVTFTLLLGLKKKSATDLEAVSLRHRDIKIWIIGLAIGILLPIIFLWFITSIVK